MPEHEVKTKLTIDHEHAKHALHEVEEGFDKVNEHVEHFGEEVVDVFKQAAATALGFQLSGIVENVKELGHELIETATGLEEQVKGIRGVLMITDEAGESFEQLTEDAGKINEELAKMAIASGQTKGALIEDFQEMATRTGLSTDAVMDLTETMSQAGRAMPGGVAALSEGFSNLASGIIRAKNPIVQLITATHELHGNAKQVAEQLKKMSPDQAMQLGINAVEKMGDKMRDVPLSFNDVVTSLKDVREELYEAAGAPMLQALATPLKKLREYLVENEEAIKHWAEEAGTEAGTWITGAAEEFKEGFQYLRSHEKEIGEGIKEAFSYAKTVIDFLWEHRKEIAELFVAKTVFGAATSLAGGIGAAAPMLPAAGIAAAGYGKFRFDSMSQEDQLAAKTAQVEKLAKAFTTVEVEKFNDYLAAQAEQIDKTGEASRHLADDVAMLGVKAGRAGDQIAAAIDRIHDLETEHALREDDRARDEQQRMDLGIGGGMGFHVAVMGQDKKPPKEHLTVPPNFNFTGNITIQQDFKDQDPDRVVLMMKRDLRREATSRLSVASQPRGTAF